MFAAAAGRRGSAPPRNSFSRENCKDACRNGNIPALVQHAWNTPSVLSTVLGGGLDTYAGSASGL